MGEGSDTSIGVPAGFGGPMFRAFDKKNGSWPYREAGAADDGYASVRRRVSITASRY
jgi:hypothetical protein